MNKVLAAVLSASVGIAFLIVMLASAWLAVSNFLKLSRLMRAAHPEQGWSLTWNLRVYRFALREMRGAPETRGMLMGFGGLVGVNLLIVVLSLVMLGMSHHP